MESRRWVANLAVVFQPATLATMLITSAILLLALSILLCAPGSSFDAHR